MEKLRAILKEMKEWLEMRELVNTLEVIDYVNRIVVMVDDMDYKNREAVKSNVYKLREEYFVIAGKKPFTGWSESVLEQKVAELKEKNTVIGRALDTKKSEWKE